MAVGKKTDDVAKLSFEQAIQELTGIVGAIEQGEVSLQDSLQQYEKGMALIQHCRGILRTAERRIEEISRVGEADERQGASGGTKVAKGPKAGADRRRTAADAGNDEPQETDEGQDEDEGDDDAEDEGDGGKQRGRHDPTSPDGPGLYD